MSDARRPPLLKVSDVAELLQVTPAFVYRHARELGAFKVGRHLRFAVSGVEAWLESCRLDEPKWDLHPPLAPPQSVPRGWLSQARSIRGASAHLGDPTTTEIDRDGDTQTRKRQLRSDVPGSDGPAALQVLSDQGRSEGFPLAGRGRQALRRLDRSGAGQGSFR